MNSLLPTNANAATSPDVPKAPRRARVRLFAIGGFTVIVLAGAVVAGAVPRLRQEQTVNDAAVAATKRRPRVTVALAQASPPENEHVLPGNALPLLEAGMFPRATGYIKTRLVDIGDRVKPGQLLAVIEAPDIDDELAQAQANLQQAMANLEKAKADEVYAAGVEQRYAKLVKTNTVAQQEFDDAVKATGVARAAVVAMQATIKVNEAAVQKYTDLQSFEKIIAPFQGVITARNIDPGDLVIANSSSRELFHIMRRDTLRVFVNVPQLLTTGIEVGQQAIVYQRDDPSKQFAGKVTRTADALEPNTRTLLTEVQVANPDNALRPGMYLQVKFILRRTTPSIRIPAAAVIVHSGPSKVGVLDSQQTVHYRVVQLGRDYGDQIEVLTGLQAGDTVIVHPGDDIPAGTVVEPVPVSK